MKHHLREKPDEIRGLEPSRTHLNVTIGAANRPALFKAIKERIATTTRKPRPDANRIIENVFTASPEFFQDMPYEAQKAYLLHCVEFAKEFYGSENIVGAYLHFDEKTPHAHVIAVPIETSTRTTKKLTRHVTTLNAGFFLGGAKKCIDLQTGFAEFIQKNGYQLERGQPKKDTNRQHIPLRQHYAEIDASHLAATELLADAATEATAATQIRREVDRELERLKIEKQDIELERAAISKRHKEADEEWSRARNARQQAQTRVEMVEKQAQKDLSGVRGMQRLAAIASRPELAGMLELLASNEKARELLTIYQQDPEMARVVENSVALAIGLSDKANEPKAVSEENAVAITALQQHLLSTKQSPTEFDWGVPGY